VKGPRLVAVLFAVALAAWTPAAAHAEQASSASRAAQAGRLDSGGGHTCMVFGNGTVHCWGFDNTGQLGYGNTETIGDDETAASAGPVDLGGHRAIAVATGNFHTCALLDDGTVRCWGQGAFGQLGYGNPGSIGDNETPAAAGPVDLGGHKATAITAGAFHTCALLDDGTVRCWGRNNFGQLGYGNTENIGDDETPASVGPVDLVAVTRWRSPPAGFTPAP
jgi:alpha-tubulin suppressor-like RCC1 family protein